MQKTWTQAINSKSDLIAFLEHMRQAEDQSVVKLPRQIRIGGSAYSTMRDKVLRVRRRDGSTAFDGAMSAFTLGASLLVSVPRQLMDMISEDFFEDQGNALRRAARIIAMNYKDIVDDSGSELVLEYRSRLFERMPELY